MPLVVEKVIKSSQKYLQVMYFNVYNKAFRKFGEKDEKKIF